ncbi:SDR family NAD(P)-dependent oxidoreductase [Qipengyuania spongiae]|uniref:SDR family NAD(P)-dependent oxidoreductase n=2 Tax=Qipengyuania spongiae TaxID=2909673 RepID=A0ABY5SWY3_9SPHN|nr:SDR family NAD(P)-dependent oxidoreductase [Qipengyuania spongiae]UVI38366.1 SDR family NAD(P)-dependent oxidoreductase [Qipengyuania spongiae]
MRMTDNTILITGGGSGIGQALAWQFAKRGNVVIVAGRTEESLVETAADHDNIHTQILDVADEASVEECAERVKRDFPEINMLIHAAGIMRLRDTGDMDLARKIIDINLLGTMRICEAFIPLLSGKPGATICTTSSGLAFVPMPVAPAYSASKAGVHSFSLQLRQRLKGDIQVIEIAPPAVQTGLTEGQETRNGYMPLDDYIEETMANFEKNPTPSENLVKNVLPFRNAEREGKVEERQDMLARMVAQCDE